MNEQNSLLENERINDLYMNVVEVIEQAKSKVFKIANFETVKGYWEIGKYIVEEELEGKDRADYGKIIISDLSKRLLNKYDKGFSERMLWYTKQFYIAFPILNALSAELSWTHYRTLLKVRDEKQRIFYMNQTIAGNWSYRFLQREIDTNLYERLILSSDKKPVMEEVQELTIVHKPEDYIKDPYVLDFLGLAEKTSFHESSLEQAIMDNLQQFLLELGRGFSFLGRQKRITVEDQHFYIDLVFYHCILKCYVIVELKVGTITPQDIGQLDFYVNYWDAEEIQLDDHPTIGLILGTGKSSAVAKYTQIGKNAQLFASDYKLYLPSEDELEKRILEGSAIFQADSEI